MPVNEKVPSIQDLILDVSGLNLDHTHIPSHSTSTHSDTPQLYNRGSNMAVLGCSSPSVATLVQAYERSNSRPNTRIAMPTETGLTSYPTTACGQVAREAVPSESHMQSTERVFKSVTVYETIC